MPQLSTHQPEHDVRNDTLKIYVNGELKPKADAMVSVYDSGYLFGDGAVSYTHLTLPTKA